jgi:spermidine synthase
MLIMRYFSYLIAALSGIAGLGYQITWSRMFAIGLGHEMPSVLAVITAFFAGLALGGWWLDRSIAIARRPARWYCGLELTIAIWVLATIFLIPLANQFCFRALGEEPGAMRHWSIAVGVPLISLLPATLAMGATLPAMDRFAASLISDKRVVGGLYGANTLGAVMGTVVSAYWLNPHFGYTQSLLMLSGVNLVCAALAWSCFGCRVEPISSDSENPIADAKLMSKREPSAEWDPLPAAQLKSTITWIAFVTGLLGIGFEVLGIRALSSVFANTVYSYAAILAVFLAGTAAGAMLYQNWLRQFDFEKTKLALLKGLILSIVFGTLLLANAHWIYFGIRERTGNLPLSELAVAGLVFLAPTLVMGAFFSLLAQAARHARGGVGLVLAVNTIGSALAPLVFGIFLVPRIGIHGGLIALLAGYSTLYLLMIWRKPELTWGLPLVVFSMWLLIGLGSPTTVLIKQGQRQVVEKPGIMTSVAVVANANEKRGLRVNNHFVMGGTQRPQFERIQGLLPLLHHGRPEKALFLGVGTGITLGSATADPQVKVTGVELIPEVVEVLAYFEPENQRPTQHPRIRLVVADARRFVRATQERFDVVVGDLYHPGSDGTGSLYSVEHFSAIRDLLTEHGLACIWLPSYQMDSEVFKMIIRSYLEVFPQGVAYSGLFDEKLMAIALISDHRFLDKPLDWFDERAISAEMKQGLASVDITDSVTLLGHLLADNVALREYAGGGQLNRDDRPVITYLAPRYVYQRYPRPGDRLHELSAVFRQRRQLVWQRLPTAQADRLRRYWQAREDYFEAMKLSHSDKSGRLLRSLQASDEFPESYREAIKIARALNAEFLPRQAIAWLTKVIALRPTDQAAKTLLNELQMQKPDG